MYEIGFIPCLPDIVLNPQLVLVLLLPPLIYSSAWFTSCARACARSCNWRLVHFLIGRAAHNVGGSVSLGEPCLVVRPRNQANFFPASEPIDTLTAGDSHAWLFGFLQL